MKHLTLVRHAKSVWENTAKADLDRPLNDRGLHDAPKMAQKVLDYGGDPQCLMSSPAKRAQQTASFIAQAYKLSADNIVVNEKLYCFNEHELLRAVHDFSDRIDHIIGVAHNPALTRLVNRLAHTRIENIPTCGVVILRFNVLRWQDVSHGELLVYDYPVNAY
jgi:phosphohistidine phosphatase